MFTITGRFNERAFYRGRAFTDKVKAGILSKALKVAARFGKFDLAVRFAHKVHKAENDAREATRIFNKLGEC